MILAVVMLSALVLNIAAAGPSYYVEFERGDYFTYASGSCATTKAQVSTSTSSRTAKVQSKICLYDSAVQNEDSLCYRGTSALRTGSSGFSLTGQDLHHFWSEHFEDGIMLYTGYAESN